MKNKEWKPSKEQIEALKWIVRSGISTQPIPHHLYIKSLYNDLKEQFEIEK